MVEVEGEHRALTEAGVRKAQLSALRGEEAKRKEVRRTGLLSEIFPETLRTTKEG